MKQLFYFFYWNDEVNARRGKKQIYLVFHFGEKDFEI